LCAELDKQKLLTGSLKNQHAQSNTDTSSELQKMKECYEQEFSEMGMMIEERDGHIQNIIREYQEKELELQ
jgi:hypothetical protein